MVTIQPKPEIVNMREVTHGGYHAHEWGARELLDFSANINPFGPSPRVYEALRGVPFERHPDPAAAELRAALAQKLALDAGNIIVGNGSLELIRNLAIAYVRAGDTCMVVGPTFDEYRAACELMGGQILEWRAEVDRATAPDVLQLSRTIALTQPRLIFVCNPNNPTGTYLSPEAIRALLRSSERSLLVLDEAFAQFASERWESRDLIREGNLIIMRSMTKDYALAGARLGYALAHADIIAALAKVQAPWSVNAFAQAAGLAALADEAHLHSTLHALRLAKQELTAALASGGFEIPPSAVHFFLMRVTAAPPFRARLLAQGINVRDCTSFGLPAFVRIATQRPDQNARLIEALRRQT